MKRNAVNIALDDKVSLNNMVFWECKYIQDLKMEELIDPSYQTFFKNSIHKIVYFPKTVKNMLFAPCNFEDIWFILEFPNVYSVF